VNRHLSVAAWDPSNGGLHRKLPSRYRHRLGYEGDRGGLPRALGEREVTIVDLAMFDAVNSIARRYQPYLTQLPTTESTSADAAAASAAATALALLHPQDANEAVNSNLLRELDVAKRTGRGS
jgi:hypothetical protein